MAYYILSLIFGAAFVMETLVTGKLFLHRENLPVVGVMRWWAVFSLGFISVTNILGFLRVYQNSQGAGLDAGNYVQAIMALSMLSLVTWAYVFHEDKWGKRIGD